MPYFYKKKKAGAWGAEEAHRPPRGKRNAWNGRQLFPPASQIKKAEDKLNFH
ncbi:hypothetical protein SD77_1105 [Bacillus badius]|uniref:Ribose 5-phosphate isomerase B n=1 Tax=Bacillus badius TaxID=1455 RepID=A0ABR5ATV8_BACBA|nr:hypothetical protein SD77_1105 [Bacillus badius]